MMAKSAHDGGPPRSIVARKFHADLSTIYVEDSERTVRLVNSDDLAELELDEAGLHELAMKNMAAAFPEIPHEEVEKVPGLSIVTANNSYDAAMVMLHSNWKPIAAAIEGDLVVAIPTRYSALFVSTSNKEVIAAMRGLAAEAIESDAYPLTDALFRWTPKGWVVHEK